MLPGSRHLRDWHALGEALLECLLLRVDHDHVVAHAPLRFMAQRIVQRLGAARERDVTRVHVGRHHREEVLGADESLEHVDERLAGVDGAGKRRVPCVEEQHEHAAAGVGSLLEAIGRAHRVAPFLACRRRRQRHALELRDLLGLAVLEHLEVVGREIGDRFPLGGGVDVHAHEVGFDAE